MMEGRFDGWATSTFDPGGMYSSSTAVGRGTAPLEVFEIIAGRPNVIDITLQEATVRNRINFHDSRM
jgi:hypothetical protein